MPKDDDDAIHSDAHPVSPERAEVILRQLASVFLKHGAYSRALGEVSNDAKQEQRGRSITPARGHVSGLSGANPGPGFHRAYLERGISEAYVSPQIESALGFSQAEWLEDPIRWYGQIHPEDKQRWSVDAAEMFLTGKPLKSAYRVTARDGRVVWFQCEVKMVRKQHGRLWFLHGIGFDISELKQTEEALQERTLEFQNLSSRLLRTQDEERRRIARELHDSLGQYLSALKMNLGMLRNSGAEDRAALSRNRADGGPLYRRNPYTFPPAASSLTRRNWFRGGCAVVRRGFCKAQRDQGHTGLIVESRTLAGRRRSSPLPCLTGSPY